MTKSVQIGILAFVCVGVVGIVSLFVILISAKLESPKTEIARLESPPIKEAKKKENRVVNSPRVKTPEPKTKPPTIPIDLSPTPPKIIDPDEGRASQPKAKLPDPPKLQLPGMQVPEEDQHAKDVPVPGEKLAKPDVPGYEARKYNGFTFLLSTLAIFEGKKAHGKPFTALTEEFDRLVEVLPKTSVPPLRKVLIWIEWDNIDELYPNALAKYYHASIWALPPTAQSLKVASIEVLSLKNLAREKDLAVDRLVLLHELAHAVHDRIVGFDNQDVLFAYQQAMDRRLYDIKADKAKNGAGPFGRRVFRSTYYAGTNANEYFAELTCAYLDRLLYYPFNRDELKEYDAAGYRLMEKVWGKPAKK